MNLTEFIEYVRINHKGAVLQDECYKKILSAGGGSDAQLICDLSFLVVGQYDGYKQYLDTKKELDSYREENKNLKNEIDKLKLELAKQKEEVDVYKETVDKLNGHWAQRELVSNGKKLAYKESASVMEVKALLDKGYSKTKIAETLGVSRNTVYRRIEEIEKLIK